MEKDANPWQWFRAVPRYELVNKVNLFKLGELGFASVNHTVILSFDAKFLLAKENFFFKSCKEIFL